MAESLREAACTGNLLAVKKLLNNGVSVNSQNSMNGWTALHWACKRNHSTIIQFLLANGADTNIKTFKGESASNLASSAEALNLLDCPLHDTMEKLECEEQNTLPIIPHYLQNPPFPYSDVIQEDLESPPLGSSDSVAQSRTDSTILHESKMDTLEACSPLKTLKIRVHGCQESDFLEIELSNQRYQALLEACAEELEINVSRIVKIRKLPNVLVCKDHHVQKLNSGQELEVFLNDNQN